MTAPLPPPPLHSVRRVTVSLELDDGDTFEYVIPHPDPDDSLTLTVAPLFRNTTGQLFPFFEPDDRQTHRLSDAVRFELSVLGLQSADAPSMGSLFIRRIHHQTPTGVDHARTESLRVVWHVFQDWLGEFAARGSHPRLRDEMRARLRTLGVSGPELEAVCADDEYRPAGGEPR